MVLWGRSGEQGDWLGVNTHSPDMSLGGLFG